MSGNPLLSPDAFSPDAIASAKAAEARQKEVQKRVDRQKVAQESRYVVQQQAPKPESTLKDIKASIKSFAKEKEDSENQKRDLLIKWIEEQHRVYKLQFKYKTWKTLREAEEEREFIIAQISQNKGVPITSMMFYGGMHAMEWVATQRWNPLGLKLEGLGKVAEANADKANPILLDIAMKYGIQMNYHPLLALGTMIVHMCNEVHKANSKADEDGVSHNLKNPVDLTGFNNVDEL